MRPSPSSITDRLPTPSVLAGIMLSVGAMLTSTFATLSFAALAPLERDALSLSVLEVGGLTALVFLGSLTVSLPAGRMTDRLGAPRTLVIAQLLVGAGLCVASAAPAAPVFLAGVAVAGVGYGAVNPATNTLVTFSVSRRHRGLLMSVKQAGVTLGGLLAGLILPAAATAVGWRAALLIPLAGLGTTSTAAIWARVRERDGWFDESSAAERNDGVPPQIRLPGPAPVGLYGFVMAGVQLSFVGYLTVFLVDHHRFSPTLAGIALGVAFAGGSLGRIVWGVVSDHWVGNHATTLAITATGSLGGLVLLAGDVSGLLLWVAIALVGFCGVGWNGVYMALAADRSRVGELGRATGRALTPLYTGVVVVPPVFGLIHGAVGSWPLTWALGAVVVTVAALAMSLSPRRAVGLPVEVE